MTRFPLRPARPAFTASVLALAVLVAVPAGCQAPPDVRPAAGRWDPVPAPVNDPRITVLAADLRPWLGFQPPLVDDSGSVLDVEVPVRNLAERMYLIDYRFVYHDADGRQLEPIMGWQMQQLLPKQLVRLTGNSLDDRAKDFRLEVKWAR